MSVPIITSWYKSDVSKQINMPQNKNFSKVRNNNINFGTNKYNNKRTVVYKFKKKIKNKFQFKDVPKIDIDKEKQKTKLKFKKCIESIKKKYTDKKQINTKIKTATTKFKKEISNINKTTICKQYTIYPTKAQITKLNKWFNECTKIYNTCVNKYNINTKLFNKSYMELKLLIFKEIYGDTKKEAPYDILTDEVRIFCSNLKSCKTNLENENISHFEMKSKNTKSSQCIFIPKTAVKSNSIYVSHMGKMKGLENLKKEEITDDCRLVYDKIKKRYTLLVPVHVDIKNITKREPVVAIDPGEKIFVAFYGLNSYGHIGINMRDVILKEEKKIRRFQRILHHKKNRKCKRMSRRGRLKIKKKINKCYYKIKNITKDLHHKTANYLCKNYDRILIPEFKTQNMVKNNNKKGAGKMKVSKIYAKEGEKSGKKALKEYGKRKRLNKRVKFVLNMLSHYRFRQHLIHKSTEYGCQLEIITEEFTSKTCTNCGIQSDNYNKREKECSKCKYKIDRDVNGSRNILIKNISLLIKANKPEF